MTYVWQTNQFSSHEICYTIQYKNYRLEAYKQQKYERFVGKIVGVRSIKLFGKTLEHLEQNFTYYVDQSTECFRPTLVNCKGVAMRIRYLKDKITGTTRDIASCIPTDIVVFEGQNFDQVVKQFEDFLARV